MCAQSTDIGEHTRATEEDSLVSISIRQITEKIFKEVIMHSASLERPDVIHFHKLRKRLATVVATIKRKLETKCEKKCETLI